MKRIFLTLAILSTLSLLAAFLLGLQIEGTTDPQTAGGAAMRYHINVSIGALVFATLIHAIVLTYFMGTGRWIEETTQAYRLGEEHHRENQKLKYRTLPAMVGVLVLLILNVPLGAVVDPASPVEFDGWAGVSATTLHLVLASVTVVANAVVSVWEYQAICRNGRLIDEIVGEVRNIRQERGLPV